MYARRPVRHNAASPPARGSTVSRRVLRHSYSRIFRAMIEDGTSSQIQLTDEVIETREILTVFLDLLHGEPLPMIDHLDSLWPDMHLLSLARKYDCPAALFTIRHFIRSTPVDHPQHALACFVALSTFEDVQGCAEAIRLGGDRRWNNDHYRGPPTARLLDIPIDNEPWIFTSSWAFDEVKETNPLFFFALTRAVRVIKNRRGELSAEEVSRGRSVPRRRRVCPALQAHS